MNKIAKTVLMTGTALCVAGVVLSTAGYFAGGKDFTYTSDHMYVSGGNSSSRKNLTVMKKEQIDDFTKLNVDFEDFDLDIRTSDDDHYYMEYKLEKNGRKNPLTWKDKDGELTLEESAGGSGSYYITYDLGIFSTHADLTEKKDALNTVVLYIPEKAQLSEAELQLSDGDLAADQLLCKEMTLELLNGDLMLDKGEFEKFDAKLSDGDLNVKELQCTDNMQLKSGNGDVTIKKAELADGIKSMESLAENPFVPQEMRDNATAELEKMRKQLELLDSADEVQVDSWLSAMIENGDAVLTDDGGFKVNPDYYKELPRNDRHVETMTEVQAVEVMSALTAAGVAYSAATKGEDKVGITVSKQDVPVLNDVMYASIGKIAHTEAAKENGGKGEKGKYQTINPEYYASLGKEDKHTRVGPIDTARQIVAELQKQNIPYSAVVRKNDTVAVTVSKANAQAYKQIESAVKGERAVEYVNPDFFKSLPKQERFTQRMDEGQARKKSAELTAKGVEHSAVFGGEKSAVTVAKKDSQRAFFSRGRMQRDAQRISGRGQQKSQQREQTPKKRKNQGLE